MSEAKKRLFIAVPVPEELLKKLEEFQKQLQKFAYTAKWVNPHGMHLTLKFLGYVETEKIPAIREALASTVSSHQKAGVRIQGCGFFPNARRPATFWAGAEAPPLFSLQQDIEESMGKLGFDKEDRPFHPHLTLARFKNPKGLYSFTEEAKKLESTEFGQFTVDKITLFESILHRTGAEYHVIFEAPLSE